MDKEFKRKFWSGVTLTVIALAIIALHGGRLMDGAILVVLAFVIIATLWVLWSKLQRILWWEPIRQWLNRSGRKPDAGKKESWCDN